MQGKQTYTETTLNSSPSRKLCSMYTPSMYYPFTNDSHDFSEATGKGWFTAIDMTAAYAPYGTSVSHATYETTIAALKFRIAGAKAKSELTPLQEAQYAIQICWLEEQKGIDVQVLREGLHPPDLETIFFSKGIATPREGDSYFVMLTGI